MKIPVFGLAALCLWSWLAPAASAFNFSTQETTVTEDGFDWTKTYFRRPDGARIFISPAPKWNVAATVAAYTAVPAKYPGAEVRLENSPFTPALAFNARNLEAYRKDALGLTSQNAAAARVDKEAADVLSVFDWRSYEFSLQYDSYGQLCRKAVIYLCLNAQEQIRVTITAPVQSFPKVYNDGLRLVRTWQQEEPFAKPATAD